MTTGYEISFDDFRYLLTDAAYRDAIAPLITGWFDCVVLPSDDEFRLVDASGTELQPEQVYDTIQANPDQQYTLYQAAMTLWR